LATEPVFADELDPDLLPVFMEEATDLLPQIGDGLRRWQQDPLDTEAAHGLLRALHTVKGSARMAGAMRLGQHTHALETQIENMLHAGTTSAAAFDELLANYDQAQLLFEQLQQPAAGTPDDATGGAPEATPSPQPEDLAAGAATPSDDQQTARAPLVRVRADILDRLVNQAGEVSITRSKLETQVGTLKSALSDFSDNLARLRQQLREVEMQAESQIASRLSIAGEREFDPLEFDRFTRLQELTRMMAESVNDVGSFHDSLTRTVDAAGEDLAAQSRLTRELQRDLMRARMVPFASLSERLFRLARQTAKETDKRVNLDIRGGAVEIDRSVLERMAAPFEHLLRNAIVHGIETRAGRVAAGKPETGELLVQASQQGNEVVIRVADDGAGLDLARIRAKAAAAGLLADDEAVSDQDAASLVFEPGFSTADALTELAGRGVGMDVVRSEARALGGRVDIETAAGTGAAFTIHLPLTLASAQVVLVASGARTHALPAVLVEQLQQVREAELAAARAAGVLRVQGEALPLHYLPELLREPGAGAAQRSYPVLILKSGDTRLALQVDEVLGNREVVVKNIGPQLARMPGIAGATVLGSGEVVLILNPVLLAGQAARLPRDEADAEALAEARANSVAMPQLPAQLPTVMVVDDSLTVRRVTQRLLEREGYRVLLAKDGIDALEQMQETQPDLMLVDIEMPRMDGFDLTRHVRGNEATRAIPIIMITSRSADKHRNYALDLGVDAYFGKPFQEDALLAAMAGLLGRELPGA
jgi:chemosensory pili system protein ChpA (sensor histidine kinase/response regulator)